MAVAFCGKAFCEKALKTWRSSGSRISFFIKGLLETDGISSIYGQHYSCQVFCLIGGKEERCVPDVGGFSQTAERSARKHFLFSFRVAGEGFGGHIRCDKAGCDTIDENTHR